MSKIILRNTPKSLFKLLYLLTPILLYLYIISNYSIYTITSGSMNNTLYVGDKVLIKKNWKSIKRNDIVVFNSPENINNSRQMIKRIIGTPLDTILIKDRIIYINSTRAEEPENILGYYHADLSKETLNILTEYNIEHFTDKNYCTYIQCSHSFLRRFENTLKISEQQYVNESDSLKSKNIIVSKDSIYVLGDNRNHSVDSNDFGLIPISNIVGVVLYIF